MQKTFLWLLITIQYGVQERKKNSATIIAAKSSHIPMQQKHFHISTIKITRMVDSRANERKDYFVASNLTVLNKSKKFEK